MLFFQRALLEGGGVDLDSEDQGDEDTSLNGHKAYAREPGDITKLSDTRSLLSDAQPTSSPGAHGADMHEKSELSLQGGVSIHEGVEPDAKNHDSSPLKTPRTSVRHFVRNPVDFNRLTFVFLSVNRNWRPSSCRFRTGMKTR
jgi:hypothetical protein